jgi:hypothetical protein
MLCVNNEGAMAKHAACHIAEWSATTKCWTLHTRSVRTPLRDADC